MDTSKRYCEGGKYKHDGIEHGNLDGNCPLCRVMEAAAELRDKLKVAKEKKLPMVVHPGGIPIWVDKDGNLVSSCPEDGKPPFGYLIPRGAPLLACVVLEGGQVVHTHIDLPDECCSYVVKDWDLLEDPNESAEFVDFVKHAYVSDRMKTQMLSGLRGDEDED